MFHTVKYEFASGNDFGAVARGGGKHIIVSATGHGKSPLYGGSPAIDYDFRYHICQYPNFQFAGQWLLVRFKGQHDGFPNYETYARVNGGAWITIYQFSHAADPLAPLGLLPPMVKEAVKGPIALWKNK
jgi:Protein of unknown function (DUF3238)